MSTTNTLSVPPDFQASLDHLKDRIIVITGAGDGIGKAAALSGAAHGATVVLLGRTLSKLEAVYDTIEAAGGKQPAIFPINFDSATEQDYTQLYSVLKEEFGRVDGVLHNASELGQLGPVENIRLADWERVLRVNATAPFMMTKALMPLLKLSSDARIVSVSYTHLTLPTIYSV